MEEVQAENNEMKERVSLVESRMKMFQDALVSQLNVTIPTSQAGSEMQEQVEAATHQFQIFGANFLTFFKNKESLRFNSQYGPSYIFDVISLF